MARLVVMLAALTAATPATAGGWGEVYSAITLASDYRYQGISRSDGEPVIQGYAHWGVPANFYLGAFATQTDYGYAAGPSFEIDLYGGKTWAFDRNELKLEAMYTAFPDDHTPGPTLNFVQVKAAARRTNGAFSFGAMTAFSPQASYGGGRSQRLEVDGVYALTPTLKIKALAGSAWRQVGTDHSYWELGASKAWKAATLEVRYGDTNLSRGECGFNPDICGPAVVGSLTVNLPPIR